MILKSQTHSAAARGRSMRIKAEIAEAKKANNG